MLDHFAGGSMRGPNILRYATKELSQDAVFAWLIEWADASHAKKNDRLHELGRAVVGHLLARHTTEVLPPSLKVRVEQQVGKIDLVAVVNDRWVLLIEDKTDTDHHSNQLQRYLDYAKGRWPTPHEVVPFFVKTGDQAGYDSVNAVGYHVVGRGDLLHVLRSDHVDAAGSEILWSFRAHLQGIEDDTQSWKSAPPADWSRRACAGFFMAIQDKRRAQKREVGNWGYVPNRSGGFMGFWFGWRPVVGGSVYAQLVVNDRGSTPKAATHAAYCVKLGIPKNGNRQSAQTAWNAMSRGIDPELGLARPQRIRSGSSMTVARVNEIRVAPSEEVLLEETLERIDRLESARFEQWGRWIDGMVGDESPAVRLLAEHGMLLSDELATLCELKNRVRGGVEAVDPVNEDWMRVTTARKFLPERISNELVLVLHRRAAALATSKGKFDENRYVAELQGAGRLLGAGVA
jgi:hypothetical protein